MRTEVSPTPKPTTPPNVAPQSLRQPAQQPAQAQEKQRARHGRQQRLKRVEGIFAACLLALDETADPDYPVDPFQIAISRLDELCGGELELRGEVESLLRHHLDLQKTRVIEEGIPHDAAALAAPRFLDPDELRGRIEENAMGLAMFGLLRGGGIDVAVGAASAAGTRIGGYTILGLLGSGGMGVVYIAEQDRPRRQIALKLIRHGLATPTMVSRFEREAEVLGRLSHPGIAQIYEAGVEHLGADPAAPLLTPYIAMELVRGPTILEHVRETRSTVRQCLELVARVCDAVQHAHLRGVIHRDLKPQNILLDTAHLVDSLPQPKVLDFGVARAISSDSDAGHAPLAAAERQVTLDGTLVGTLAYMSPEQASGASSRDVDARSDVYALGAILYHLLAGKPPHDASQRSIPEMMQAICHDDPPSLSDVERTLRGEVETIVGKAIAKNRARRYQSAAELADDIRRYLRGEPIAARQDSALYVLRKQVRRHRAAVAAAVFAMLALVAFTIYAAVEQHHQRQAARIAIAALHDAQAQKSRADLAAERLTEELSASRVEQGRLLGLSGAFRSAEDLIWREHLLHPNSVRSHWALWELYGHYLCKQTIAGHTGPVRAIAWRPDNQVIATSGDDGFIKIYDRANSVCLATIETPFHAINTIAFAGNDTILACGDGPAALLFDTNNGRVIRRFEDLSAPVWSAERSDDGHFLATGGQSGRACLWDFGTGKLLSSVMLKDARAHAVPVRKVCFNRAGDQLAATCEDGSVRIWRSVPMLDATEPLKLDGHPSAVIAAQFSPDGKTLATGGYDRSIKLWDATTGALVKTLEPNNGTIYDIDYSPDGKWIASVGWWRADVYDTLTWQRYRPNNADWFAGHAAFEVRFSPDGEDLASGSGLGAVRIAGLHPGAEVHTLGGHSDLVTGIAVARGRDGVVLASTGNDGRINVWKRPLAPDGRWARHLSLPTKAVLRAIALTSDGAMVAASGMEGVIGIWDTTSGKLLAVLNGHRGLIGALAFTRDGQRLISGGADVTLRIWHRDPDDPRKWSLRQTLNSDPGEVLGLAVSDDNKIVATTHRGAQVRFWSLAEEAPLASRILPNTPWMPAFSHRHERLVLGGWDRSVELLDISDIAHRAPTTTPASNFAPRLATFPGHMQLVTGAAFSNDDQLIATASGDGLVKLWDAAAGDARPAGSADATEQNCLATLDGHGGRAFQVAFLPEPLGHLLAVGYQDGNVRVWDLSYFDRYIAGQIEFQIRQRQAELGDRIDARTLRAWAAAHGAAQPPAQPPALPAAQPAAQPAALKPSNPEPVNR